MAQDNDKHPKEPFNAAAKDPGLEITFESDFDDDLNNDPEQQHRGNTDPKHDPKNERNPYLTPMGSGPKIGGANRPERPQGPSESSSLKEATNDEEWQEQLRNGNHTYEGEFNGLRVRAWLADKPSNKGIHNGHINKMIVTQGEYGAEVEVAQFSDGEWEKSAESAPQHQAILEAVQEYDGEFLTKKREQEQKDREHQQQIDRGKDTGKSR